MALPDSAYVMLDYLKSAPAAAAVRAFVTDVSYIREAGDMTGNDLTSSESLRINGGDPELVLGITVQDDGEEPELGRYIFRQNICVRVLDRRQGYANIREARNLIKEVFSVPVIFDFNGKRGMLALQYGGRSGYQFDDGFFTDFEVINYSAVIEEVDQD